MRARRWLRRLRDRLRPEPTLRDLQARRAWEDAQDFLYAASTTATRLYDDHRALRRSVFSQRPEQGLLLEFGVYRGASLTAFAGQLDEEGDARTLFGFDSFSGFSEEWTGVEGAYPRAHFDLAGGRPAVPSNCRLVEGFVEETLPRFLDDEPGPVAFVHIDTDTYSPARTVLESCRPRLAPGSIVLFDELAGYPNWRSHEYRALSEVLAPDEYVYLGFAVSGPRARLIKAAIRIEKPLG
jgi:predicted O-methyltransferase YrrM